MTRELVEVNRVSLNAEDAAKLKHMQAALASAKLRFADAALVLRATDAQYQAQRSKLEEQVQAAQAAAIQVSTELQSWPQSLVEQYGINLSEGSWSLNMGDAAFVCSQLVDKPETPLSAASVVADEEPPAPVENPRPFSKKNKKRKW